MSSPLVMSPNMNFEAYSCVTRANVVHRKDVHGEDQRVFSGAAADLDGHLRPASGRGAEIGDAHAFLQEVVAHVDLGQLERRSAAVLHLRECTAPSALRGRTGR